MNDKAMTQPRPVSRPERVSNPQAPKPLPDALVALQQSLDRRW